MIDKVVKIFPVPKISIYGGPLTDMVSNAWHFVAFDGKTFRFINVTGHILEFEIDHFWNFNSPAWFVLRSQVFFYPHGRVLVPRKLI